MTVLSRSNFNFKHLNIASEEIARVIQEVKNVGAYNPRICFISGVQCDVESCLMQLYVGPCHMVSAEIAVAMAVHHPYSPDLAPSDFSMFPKMKERLAGKRFANVEGCYRDQVE